MPIITTTGLSKRYSGSDKYALRELSLSVNSGEVYGFLGPNGAGKSTTIRLLMNFIQPTNGNAQILNQDVVAKSADIKQRVGYLSGESSLYLKMTGRQYLDYMSDLLASSSLKYQRSLVKRFNADLGKKLGELSRGNQQKIAIIQAFMHQPQVLILDEPSSGLDPLMQEEFYKLIRETKQRGAAVFMSSHIFSEVQKVCDRIGIIKNGELIVEKNIDDIAVDSNQIFEIVFSSKPLVSEFKKLSCVQKVSTNGNQVILHVRGNMKPLFALLAKKDVLRMDTRKLDLEEVFLHYYKSSEAK